MIRQVDENEFYICYDGDGSYFAGPYSSKQRAEDAFEAMCKFDQMVVSGRGPYLRTDVEFLKESENGRQFQDTPGRGDLYRKNCEKAGGSVKGKKYIHQLARFPGDPRAWVSSRGDVESVARSRGMGVEGLVDVKTPEVERPADVKVDPKIVERELNRALKFVRPGEKVSESTKQEMREAIVDTIGPKT